MPTKKPQPKSRRASQEKSDTKLVRENKELMCERDESLEREAATSDILRMIARSPAELQPVLDAIAERAARLCDAENAAVFRVDGEVFTASPPTLGPFPMATTLAAGSLIAEELLVERLSTAKRSMSTTFRPPKLNFPSPVE